MYREISRTPKLQKYEHLGTGEMANLQSGSGRGYTSYSGSNKCDYYGLIDTPGVIVSLVAHGLFLLGMGYVWFKWIKTRSRNTVAKFASPRYSYEIIISAVTM